MANGTSFLEIPLVWLLRLGNTNSLYLMLMARVSHMYPIQAWPLIQLDTEFRGCLPELKVDESRIPANCRHEPFRDCLLEHEAVKALVPDMNVLLDWTHFRASCVLLDAIYFFAAMTRKSPCTLLPKFNEVAKLHFCSSVRARQVIGNTGLEVCVYDYTCHLTTGNLADKMGSCLFIRRSLKGHSCLISLLRTMNVFKVSSDSLSHLLKAHHVSMRKTATKICKIRELAKLDTVMKDLTPEEATALENKLQEMESKKKKKDDKDNEENMEDPDCDSWLFLHAHHDIAHFVVVLSAPNTSKDIAEDEDDAAINAARDMLLREVQEDQEHHTEIIYSLFFLLFSVLFL